jgi:hypothetical protein
LDVAGFQSSAGLLVWPLQNWLANMAASARSEDFVFIDYCWSFAEIHLLLTAQKQRKKPLLRRREIIEPMG